MLQRSDFPVFSAHPGLVYLDSASTTQKPRYVIDRVAEFLATGYANIHRGAYTLSETSESLYDASKRKVCELIGATYTSEIVYTYNATYGLNLLAQSLRRSGRIVSGDTILLSPAEHHANIVPWLILAEEVGARVEYVALRDDFSLDMDDFVRRYDDHVRIVSLTAASNVTGARFDLVAIGRLLRDDTYFFVDASQGVPNFRIDVGDIGCDALVFSGHKMLAETGIGVLWGRKDFLRELTPAFSGGGAINWVKEQSFSPAGLPDRWEPGTPHIVGAVSLLAALEYFESVGGYEALATHEYALSVMMADAFARRTDRIRVIGPEIVESRVGVWSFTAEGIHPGDMAEFFASRDICVRAGLHCAEPLAKRVGVAGTVRASLYLYNTPEDVVRFFEVLDAAVATLG